MLKMVQGQTLVGVNLQRGNEAYVELHFEDYVVSIMREGVCVSPIEERITEIHPMTFLHEIIEQEKREEF